MPGFLLSWTRPRSPGGSLLLGDPDQHHAILAFPGRCFQVGASHFLLVLSFLEVHNRNVVPFSKLVDSLHIGFTDLPKRRRRGNLELPLPAQEDADLPHRLQLGYVRLQEDSVDGTALERHVVSQ